MTDILEKIFRSKRQRVESAEAAIPERLLREKIDKRRRPLILGSFARGLSGDGVNIIAEIKRRSPSKGILRTVADAAEVARSYEANGAACLSVLTEEDHFDGSLDDLIKVSEAVTLPIIRKDFVFTEYQIVESAAAGADAILLIAAMLDDKRLTALMAYAYDLQLDVLTEVHSENEMRRATEAGATLIGVNNRDLRTFEVFLHTSVVLAKLAPAGATLISESGISSADDITILREAGFHGFLIGESFMRAEDPGIELGKFLGRSV